MQGLNTQLCRDFREGCRPDTNGPVTEPTSARREGWYGRCGTLGAEEEDSEAEMTRQEKVVRDKSDLCRVLSASLGRPSRNE